MTFSAAVEAATLSSALDPVTALVDECKIHVEEDGLEIRAVDPANVGMVDLKLDASACAHYDADGGVIGVNLERFTDVIGMADGDEMVRLDLDNETQKLQISVGGLAFTLALIDPDAIRQEPDIPDLDLPATVALEGRAVGRAITAADLCSDHISISASDSEIAFAAEGDTDDVELTIPDEDLLSLRYTGERDTVQSLFSLDYLEDIETAIPASADVSLLIGNEMPIKMRYRLADDGVEVVNLLAPRIQGD